MAALTIDPIPEPLLEALRHLAAEHRRSPEDEARAILERVLPSSVPDVERELEAIRELREKLFGKVTPLSDEILARAKGEGRL